MSPRQYARREPNEDPLREPKIHNLLKSKREQAGLSQQALADQVGVSRQAILKVEAGRQMPSTALGLLLARALDCRLEQLFRLDDGDTLIVQPCAAAGERVALGRVGDRWVAHPLHADGAVAADGLMQDANSARPLEAVERLERNVLVAGCAPLLGGLAQRVGARFADARMTWLGASSQRALELLADGLLHVAGIHLCGATSPDEHVAVVRARFPGRRMLIANLTRWRQGLVVAKGNPLGLTSGADLLRPGLRLARREPGAGAHKLVGRLLTSAGAPDHPLHGPEARDHAGVAQLVRWGAADVGVAIESVALAADLSFIPLAEERFDLVLPAELTAAPHVARLLDALDDDAFRADVARIAGYDSALAGEVTTVEAA
jgi:putative molybdopterin biosynthesis protein